MLRKVEENAKWEVKDWNSPFRHMSRGCSYLVGTRFFSMVSLGLGLGIRFFGYVRFGLIGVSKLRFTKNWNRSALHKIKNRAVRWSVFRFGFRFLPKFTELWATSTNGAKKPAQRANKHQNGCKAHVADPSYKQHKQASNTKMQAALQPWAVVPSPAAWDDFAMRRRLGAPAARPARRCSR